MVRDSTFARLFGLVPPSIHLGIVLGLYLAPGLQETPTWTIQTRMVCFGFAVSESKDLPDHEKPRGVRPLRISDSGQINAQSEKVTKNPIQATTTDNNDKNRQQALPQ
jgi:hypothetical protein